MHDRMHNSSLHRPWYMEQGHGDMEQGHGERGAQRERRVRAADAVAARRKKTTSEASRSGWRSYRRGRQASQRLHWG